VVWTNKIEVLAPGRICLFGDHQDYLGLPIIACAIDRNIKLKAKLNNLQVLRINMPDIKEERRIDLQNTIEPISDIDYFVSSIKVLKEVACFPNEGFDIEITGDIPINAGLSSSSAIIVAWIAFLLKAYGSNTTVTPELIGKLAYNAEVVYYKAPGGLMDQYTISIGNLLFIDTVDGHHTVIDKKMESLIVGESGVPKKTLGVLKNLRGNAQRAITSVQKEVSGFRMINSQIEDYEKYKHLVADELKPIFFAAIRNFEITKLAYKELQNNEIDLFKVGELMSAHHVILKNILKITVPIIDDMIDGAMRAGALGAKIVGSGGGGSIVALTTPENEANVIKGILEGGAKSAYKVHIADGVRVV